jgi:NAD(P)-dependent dehydrogenase (short-subunit alcohol dehydrogenase family)
VDRLDGKVALISGAARGQGAEEARLFAKEGATVVIGDIRDDEGRQVAAEIRGAGGAANYVHLDVTSEEAWANAVRVAIDKTGSLNILVNNAGINNSSPIEGLTVDEWDKVMGINLKGVFLGTKYAAAAMRRSGGGSIINISSTAGMVANPGMTMAAYTASKGGVRLLTKATAIELASDNIRCNSVHPGIIQTDMIQDLMANKDLLARRLSNIPLGRLGTALDVALTVLFLASDESAYVTGSEFVVDGGLTAQ